MTTRNEKGRTLGRDMALFVLALFGAVTFGLAALLATEARGQSSVNNLTPATGSDVESLSIRTNFSTIKSELNTLFNRFPSSTAVKSIPAYSDGSGNLSDPNLCFLFPNLVQCNAHLELYGRSNAGTVLGIVGNSSNSSFFKVLDGSSLQRVNFTPTGVQFTGGGGANQAFIIESGAVPTTDLFQVKQAGVEVLGVAPDGNVDITVNDTDTALAITQSSSGKLLSVETNTDGDNPKRVTIQGRVTTANATETTVATVPTSTNSITYIKATIVARVTGGAGGYANQGAAFEIHGAFDNVSGTVNELATTAITEIALTDTNTGGYVVDLDQSSTNVLVTVTGGAADNVTWHATVEYMSVGS